ncbi:MAG: dihydrodipicolinate synthase family protein [Dehalococcoidia bacterium]|nr:dihydrodipicolinate synthase family protein [Dehalococcoidia bacterium]
MPMSAKTPNLAACVTPLTSRGALDEAALRRHMRFMRKRNIGLCLGAYNTGQGLLLTPREVRRIYEIGVEELKGKVPVYAVSLGYTATAVVIKKAREAAAIGVDGVQLYPPRPGPAASPVPLKELDRFYRDLFEAVDGPLVLGLQSENMPEKTFPVDVMRKWFDEYPHIAGINCTARDEGQLRVISQTFGSRVPVRNSGAGNVFANLESGGVGFLGSEANVAPTFVNNIVSAWKRGDMAAAKENLAKVQRLGAVLRQASVRSEQAAVHLLGRIGPTIRRPYLPLEGEQLRAVAAVLDELGISTLERGDG